MKPRLPPNSVDLFQKMWLTLKEIRQFKQSSLNEFQIIRCVLDHHSARLGYAL